MKQIKTIPAALEQSGKTLYLEYVRVLEEKTIMRAKVDLVERQFLKENEWFEDRGGKRILEHGRAYRVKDIAGYCRALEEKKRESGLMEGIEAGFCPALILESQFVKIEWMVLEWTEELLGEVGFAERVNLWMDKRGQTIELFLRLFVGKV